MTRERKQELSRYPTQNIELCAKDEEITELKSLIGRAADALDQFHGRYYVIENCDCAVCNLTRELRKAARVKGPCLDPDCDCYAEISRLKGLLRRAADGLEKYTSYPIGMVMSASLRESGKSVLAELRKAPEIQTQLTQAHQDYEAFINNQEHIGLSAEGFWMASRGLLEPWLAEIQAEYNARKAKPEPSSPLKRK